VQGFEAAVGGGADGSGAFAQDVSCGGGVQAEEVLGGQRQGRGAAGDPAQVVQSAVPGDGGRCWCEECAS
jgi:hypothetical protein